MKAALITLDAISETLAPSQHYTGETKTWQGIEFYWSQTIGRYVTVPGADEFDIECQAHGLVDAR